MALVRADEVIEAVVSSPTHPRCCDAGRPIGDARVGAGVADRPAAFPLAELEQRTSASVVDRDVFSRRLRPPERHQARTL